MADSSKFKSLVVKAGPHGRVYELDGSEVDLKSDKKSDEGIRHAIDAYKPTKGEYHFNPEDNTLLPAGRRAGTGDTGMYPDYKRPPRNTPAANSYDAIGAAAVEESELVNEQPAAGVTDDKALEKQQKDEEKRQAEEDKLREKEAAEREKTAKKTAASR